MSRAPARTFVTRAQAEQAARQAEPASSSLAPGALRQIAVMLSPLAPGCHGLPLDHYDRWRWLVDRTPAAALRMVLRRLRRTADQVALRHTHGLAGTEIHDGANDPPAGCERLLAIIFDAAPDALFDAQSQIRRGLAPSAAEPA